MKGCEHTQGKKGEDRTGQHWSREILSEKGVLASVTCVFNAPSAMRCATREGEGNMQCCVAG